MGNATRPKIHLESLRTIKTYNSVLEFSHMKIGIATLHANTNYGANLQAFATTVFLEKNGLQANVINHSIDDVGNSLLPWLLASWNGEKSNSFSRKVKLGLALLASIPYKATRLHRFHRFQDNYLRLTRKCYDNQQIAALGFDTIICGSDQIWNPDITNGLNPVFFGRIDGVKTRIAYAASIGKAALNPADEAKLRQWANELDACSLREAKSAEYLSQLTKKNSECVCDPTLLLQKADYERIAKRKISGRYVLLYSIVSDKDLTRQAEAFASKNGLELIEICSGKSKNRNHKQIVNFGPEEFLGAILDAQYVFTNSFHGVALSILLHKQFYAYENPSRKGRITNLLEKAGLVERLLNCTADIHETHIDYDVVDLKLKEYTTPSKEFLLKKCTTIDKTSLIGDQCVGCGACFEICHHDAIRMYPDREGFLNANIDTSKCINCGRCKNVCQVVNPVEGVQVSAMYALKAPDDLRARSASGGAFAAFARYILEKKGSVYGAYQDDCFRVFHKRCDNERDLALLQGTKYVQSDIRSCYSQLSGDLKAGKHVLFSGTPCQVAAIKNYVKETKLPSSTLYTTDIVCHGVPSPSVYSAFIQWLKTKNDIKEYSFRSKKVSWRGNSCMVKLQDGTELKNDRIASSFMNLYYSGNITRKSCYTCPCASEKRISDVTIGDFWGIEETDIHAFEDHLGISMVIPNTDKGKHLMDNCEASIQKTEIVTSKQPQLRTPSGTPVDRNEFWKIYTERGMYKTLLKYGGIKQNLKSRIKKWLMGKK